MRLWLPVVVSWSLACGGLLASVEPGPHLRQICDQEPVFTPSFDLVQLDLPVVELSPATQVEVHPDRVTLDGRAVDDASALAGALREAKERSRALAEAAGTSTGSRVLVAVHPGARGGQLVELFRAFAAAELRTIDLVVASGDRVPEIPYPDPAFGASVEAELKDLPPEERAVRAAAVIEEVIALCPGAKAVFGAVANASPEMRCAIVAHGMEEALPMCLATDSDQAVTAVQVILRPTSPFRLTALRLELAGEDNADAAVLDVPDAPWAEIAPGWLELNNQTVRLP